MFKGPGEGTLKFCGVRAVTGLWEGCGEGLGRKLLGDGAGPELTLELGCELGWPGCGDGCGGGGIDCGVCTCWPGDGEDSMVRLFWLTCAEGCPPKGMELDWTADTAVVGGNRALTCIPPWAKAAAIISFSCGWGYSICPGRAGACDTKGWFCDCGGSCDGWF